ncbi:MAG: zf-TFIIB domain-containing protein [Vulcanimicrobiota bacterium]
MDTIVAEMRDAARLDSSGSFTLDASRAIDKMRRFQVERPQDFVLWLGAAAVAGGATQFLVTLGVSQICVEFDGQHFLPDEMQRILDQSGNSQSGRVGHLAFALTAALGTQPDEIIIESWDQRLQISPGTTRLSKMLDSPVERVRFLIVRQQSRASAWESEQFNYLRERIPQKLLKISVNRRQDLGYRLPADMLHGQHFWQGSDSSELMQRLISGENCRVETHEGNFSVLLALDSWHRQSPSQILFLYDGLLMPVEVNCPFCFRAVVSWPEITLNLSRTAMVESAQQRLVVDQVSEMARQVARDFIRHYAELKPGLRHLAQPWLASVADSESSLAPECRQMLNSYHSPGFWLERDDPGTLVKELLQNFVDPTPAPPQVRQRPAAPRGFWASLAAMFEPAPFERQQGQLESLRGEISERKKWRTLLAGLLAVFDPQSTLRLGLSAAVPDPEWLVLEGVLPDGTHLLLRAEPSGVSIRCFYSKDWSARAGEGPVQVPSGWQSEQVGDLARFRGGSWKQPEALLSLLRCVLDSRRQAQSQEVLDCPGCGRPMDKLILDLVLDRCHHCQTLWLDYAELEWLLKARPDYRLMAPPGAGKCPRCSQVLVDRLRSNRAGLECPKCRGFWLAAAGR